MSTSGLVICAIVAALALAAPNARRGANGSEDKQAATTVPMKVISCGSNNECYRIDVWVGTPPQKYRLTLDNTLFDTIHVFSSNMTAPNSTCKWTDIGRKRFNPGASSTYVEDGEQEGEGGGQPPYYPYEDAYRQPKCRNDTFGFGAHGFNDTVEIGSVSLPSVPANLITYIQAPLNPEWDADGFFGIRPPYDAADNAWDTLSVFLSAFERPSLTFYYARVDYFDMNSDNGGALTFGGADASNCDNKWTKVTSIDAFTGAVLIKSFSINGKSVRSHEYASIGTTTSYITMPQTAIDAVVKATGAEYDFKSDTFQVDCDKRASLPDMVFKLPGIEYRLPAVDYARRRSASSRRCTLMLVPPPSTYVKDWWSFGTSFFRPYCTLLDLKAQTFSLAKALH
ncbi:Protein ASP-7 [Aphelenchoides avenae]|nr:Protein ASP-7 [Aphelenchus avenae]